jgi:uncharacterized protein (TIRG00374 family)
VKKNSLATLAILVALTVLFARQFHNWQDLQWGVFRGQLSHLKWLNVVIATVLFYTSFVVRAWRWKIFLKHERQTTTVRMLGPTFVGFAAAALVGAAGEFSRPYLIAKKENLTVSSQMGVWTVERIFDVAAFALLLLLAALFVDVKSLPYLEQFHRLGLLLIVIAGVTGLIVWQMERNGTHLERMVERALLRMMPRLARRVANRVGSFSAGLKMFTDRKTLIQIVASSLLMWAVITLAYHYTIHAFPTPLRTMPLGYAPLVLAFAIVGGLVQLPASATSQLMVIAALLNVFRVPGELAVSCGIALWLGAYVAPVPVGLLYLRHEHLSLGALSRQSAVLQSREPAAEEVAAVVP